MTTLKRLVDLTHRPYIPIFCVGVMRNLPYLVQIFRAAIDRGMKALYQLQNPMVKQLVLKKTT